MKIFLNDVTAKFNCVSLSEELLEGSSIVGVSGFDERTGEGDRESSRVVLRGVKDLPLVIFGVVGLFGVSEREGLVCLGLMLPDRIGEVVEPNAGARVTFLDPSCGEAYDDRISYARIIADDSGVRVSMSCPLLKLVRLDEAGEGEGEGDHEAD